MQEANIVVNNMCSFVIKHDLERVAINVLCDHFSCRISTQDKIVALALLFLLIRTPCCSVPWPQCVAVCHDSCMTPISFRFILHVIRAGSSWGFLVPSPLPLLTFTKLTLQQIVFNLKDTCLLESRVRDIWHSLTFKVREMTQLKCRYRGFPTTLRGRYFSKLNSNRFVLLTPSHSSGCSLD